MKEKMRLLSEMDIRQVLSPGDVIETVEEVFHAIAHDQVIFANLSKMDVNRNANNIHMTFPVALKDRDIAGLKWFGAYMERPEGYPFSHGNLILIIDTKTGSPIALTGATEITTMRTAGGHAAVAAKYLAKKNPVTLTIIGCGGQGTAGIEGFLHLFPTIKYLRIFDTYTNSCEKVTKQYGDRTEVYIAKTPEEAVQGSDIVLMATNSPEILVLADWLEPGMTVIGLTGFVDLDPNVASKADKWVLGNHEEDHANILESPSLTRGYRFTTDQIYADMSEIVSGRNPGRENNEEIILYLHMGMGAFDLACAHKAYLKAVEMDIGQEFVLNEF